ncbi:hypothetical protein C3L33_05528, partial [Rhododendron williamsianum]
MNNPLHTTKEPQTNPKLTSTATIKITRDQINTLKANSEHDKNPERYSTYETLAAHVWQCSCIARGLGDDQATKLYIATDGRLPVHDADFGWGRPVHMGPAGVRFEGIVYILPNPAGDGSLCLVICLEADHMEVFKAVFHDF